MASWLAIKKQVIEILETGSFGGLVAFQNQVANPGGEVDTSQIIVTGGTVATTTDQHVYGLQSIQLTASAAADKIEWDSQAVKMTVVAGEPYTFSLHIMPKAGSSATGRIGVGWYTSGDVFISNTETANFTVTSGDPWTRRVFETTAPATAALARPYWREIALFTVGRVLYFDGVSFIDGLEQPYWDGNFPGCDWDGGVTSAEIDTSNVALKKVFEAPPNGIKSDEWPCAILGIPEQTSERRGAGWVVKRYELPISVVVADARLETAGVWADRFREVIRDAFDGAVRLHELCTVIDGPRFEESAGPIRYGETWYTAIDGKLSIRVDESTSYAA